MVLSAHTIHAAKGAKKNNVKRVGRGNGSGKGSYSARGMKGQRARSGGKRGVERLGFKRFLQQAPKSRGFKSFRTPEQTVTLATLNRIAVVGEPMTPALLKKANAIKDVKAPIKIVATGVLDKAISVTGCLASKTAIDAIEKAGGTITF